MELYLRVHLAVSEGQDLLDGGAGNDIFWIGDVGTDTFLGGSGTDTIRLLVLLPEQLP